MLYIDTADIKEIEWWVLNGGVQGVTTNPSIVQRDAPGVDVRAHLATIAAFLRETCGGPLHIQLGPTDNPEAWDLGTNVVLKCPMTEWGLEMAALAGGPVNITAIMSIEQARLALAREPDYISIFWGRILDTQRGPADVVVRAAACRGSTKIVVGSIREPWQVVDALESGADIVTASPKVLRAMMQDPATDKILGEWYGSGP